MVYHTDLKPDDNKTRRILTILTNESNTPSAHSHPNAIPTPRNQALITNPRCLTSNQTVHAPPPIPRGPNTKCAAMGRRRVEKRGSRMRMGRRRERERKNTRRVSGYESVVRRVEVKIVRRREEGVSEFWFGILEVGLDRID
jgi:hypothetical protein